MVSWQHGDEDTIILNVDGSALNNSGKANYGGLIRKHDGSFLRGLFGSVGISNILHAEIQTLLIGIKLCWETGYRKLMCFFDFIHVVELVMKDISRFHHYSNLLELIQNYLDKDWFFLFSISFGMETLESISLLSWELKVQAILLHLVSLFRVYHMLH